MSLGKYCDEVAVILFSTLLGTRVGINVYDAILYSSLYVILSNCHFVDGIDQNIPDINLSGDIGGE